MLHIHSLSKVTCFQAPRLNSANTRMRTFFSELISKYVFDILKIPSGCAQICSGGIAPICTRVITAAVSVHVRHYLLGHCISNAGCIQANSTKTYGQLDATVH
jgi:hypothetical protein